MEAWDCNLDCSLCCHLKSDHTGCRLEGLASMADTRAAAESRLRFNGKKVKREAPAPNTRVS